MSSFRLQIVTPEGGRFDGEAEALHLRTTEGYVSIRAGHADYLAALDVGCVTVTSGGEEKHAACSGGFLSVEKGAARLVASTFEYAQEIDAARAAAAEADAQATIERTHDAQELAAEKFRLACARNRQKIASEFKK